ncbi:hypothetical protein ACQR1Y_12070 [Bradyrhizobium sp. HKCCYLRH3099]|uniref:hypothetical protein n=1 Tax=unclassified Bradyrhizobium TaxID=2631580 RepID=UPI003EB8ED41
MTTLNKGVWTRQDMGIAASLWQDRVVDRHGEDAPGHVKAAVYKAIAVRLNRAETAVRQRMASLGPSFGLNTRMLKEAPNAAEIERSARERAARQMSLTASVFGDPPPGYSALDRRGRDAR